MIMFGAVGLLVAAYVGKRLLAGGEPDAAPATRNVPMALSDLEPGMVIRQGDIGLGPTRVENLQPSTFLSEDTLVGRVVKERIPAARPITTGQLYKLGETPPLVVAEGRQAVSIALGDNTAIVNGLIKPGDYVDILLTPDRYQDIDRMGKGMTMTMMKGVKLLTINRSFRSGGVSGSGNAVTLELTPTQARVVTLAQTAGELKLVLNPLGPGDPDQFAGKFSDRITIEELLNLPPEEEPADPDPPFVTEHFTRGRRTVFEFQDGRRVNGNTDPRPIQRGVQQNSSDPPATNDPGLSDPVGADTVSVDSPTDSRL